MYVASHGMESWLLLLDSSMRFVYVAYHFDGSFQSLHAVHLGEIRQFHARLTPSSAHSVVDEYLIFKMVLQ